MVCLRMLFCTIFNQRCAVLRQHRRGGFVCALLLKKINMGIFFAIALFSMKSNGYLSVALVFLLEDFREVLFVDVAGNLL